MRLARRMVLAASVTGVAAAVAGVTLLQVVGPQTPAVATPPPLRLQYPADAPPASAALTSLAEELQTKALQPMPEVTECWARRIT